MAKPARKTAKTIPVVKFSSEMFDGEFELPSWDCMPLGMVESLNLGDLGALFRWIIDSGGDPDSVAAMRGLTKAEWATFRGEWGAASGVDPTE